MKQRKITDLLALLVFAVFALCILLVLLTGAGAYRNLVRQGQTQYHSRTALQYLSTRVRQAESVALEDFEGCEALACRERVGEKTYVTRVYCFDGWLRELFCAEMAQLSPEDGEKVLEADRISFQLETDLLTVQTDGGKLTLLLRSGREIP